MKQREKVQARRASLSPAKQALLAKRIASSTDYGVVIQRRPNQTSYPLSFAQERLWFLNQLEPDSPAYNRPLMLRLSGMLNRKALEQALSQIVSRHEVLRSTYSVVEGQPCQQIKPVQPISLPVVDLCSIPEKERDHKVNALLMEEAKRTFDLSDNVLHATLLCLAQEEHILALVIHHIAFDAWSAQCLIRELRICYEAAEKGEECPLPDLPIQVADVAHWQQQHWQGAWLEEQLSYWKKQLADISSLNLPTDYPRPLRQTYHAGQELLTLPRDLVNDLQLLSQHENVTLFMVLLSAFQILLHRYTSQDDIVVGSPVAGRFQVEMEELIGCFLNAIVLRTDLSGNPTFRQLLARVRQMVLDAYAYQALPFEQLVSQLQPKRDSSRTPLFQVLFNFEVFDDRSHTDKNRTVTIQEVEFERFATPFDLTVEIILRDQNLHCLFVYNANLFEADTIQRMAGHFQILLHGIIEQPEARISELPLLTEAERHQLLVAWNDTAVDVGEHQTIHAFFEQQAEQTPDAIAVLFEDQQLSYTKLNQRANQLAHWLKKQGIGPEMMVCLYIERSIEAIIGILGILKSGAAYVPLDPTLPPARIATMMQATGRPMVVTLDGLPDSLRSMDVNIDVKVVSLARNRQQIESQPRHNLSTPVTACNLAYVIYTSGSTGQPKGVEVEHRSLINYVDQIQKEFNLGPGDRSLLFASLSFDTSIQDIFVALTAGLTLYPRTPEMLNSVAHFLTCCREWGLTYIAMPTAYWHEIVAYLSDETVDEKTLPWPTQLRACYVGGEKFQPVKLATWHRLMGGRVRLVNGYGPTETAIACTLCDLTNVGHLDGEVPIGRPIQNMQAYILDSYLNPVPVSVPGELHIGGIGLARGYLNQPTLTAQKFIQDPFGDEHTPRLYKTGDLARYWPDGRIKYLGRTDSQVKIRGFRIELGEIESALLMQEGVNEVVVLVREDDPENKRLVAYIVDSGQLTVDSIPIVKPIQA